LFFHLHLNVVGYRNRLLSISGALAYPQRQWYKHVNTKDTGALYQLARSFINPERRPFHMLCTAGDHFDGCDPTWVRKA